MQQRFRDTHSASKLHAAMKQEAPHIRAVDPELPPALDRVLARARTVSGRPIASAEEMRIALEIAVPPVSREVVAAKMHELFADEREELSSKLRSLAETASGVKRRSKSA